MRTLLWVVIICFIGVYFSSRKNRKAPNHSPSNTAQTLARHGIGKRRQSRKLLVIEKPNIDLSDEITKVLEILENTNTNIFLTGRAGTGKSTLLRYFRATTKKNIVVLAPTGVAAVNVQGETIHHFFKFYPGVTEDKVSRRFGEEAKIYKKVDVIVIDEVSMVRADLFDCVDKFLRLNGPDSNRPFGGIQIVAIGDLYQLPPVVGNNEKDIFESHYPSPYFFDAKCYRECSFLKVELTHVYRQAEQEFVDILDAIRTSKVNNNQIGEINKRVISSDSDVDFQISLVPTNAMAYEINMAKLAQLPGEPKHFQGVAEGDFPEKTLPTPSDLVLKENAQIMLLNNDPKSRWINGDLAKILTIGNESIRIIFEDGTFDDIVRHTWDKISFAYDNEEKKIVSEITGSYIQFPMKLAWALTIHKAQGKTYDKVVIDFGSGTFASGQAYVALSRSRSLNGLILKTPLELSHIFVDSRIEDFLEK